MREELDKLVDELKKQATSTNDQQVQDAISQLSSCMTLLNMSSTTIRTLNSLAFTLRRTLTPLYSSYTKLAFTFCASVAQAVNEIKIPVARNAKDEETVLAWEQVQHSLLSSVMDYLEQHPTEKNKLLVGEVFYPLLCPAYFASPSTPLEDNARLLSLVYMLLSESVSKHPKNQSILRDERVLGGRKIGLTLSQMKSYLALEALLELFAHLIPPASHRKGAVLTRNQFVHHVFDGSLSVAEEKDFLDLLANASKDWENTSLKIVRSLATTNACFPQPFDIQSPSISIDCPPLTNLLIVDEKGFTSNMLVDEGYETFHAPFETVQRIILPTASASDNRISIELKSPPVVGNSPCGGSTVVSISFGISPDALDRFSGALSHRGVKFEQARKISKLGAELQLSFSASGKSFPTKAEEVYNLGDSTSRPSSPLFEQRKKETINSAPSPLVVEASDNEAEKAQFEHEAPRLKSRACARQVINDSDDESSPPENKGQSEGAQLRHSEELAMSKDSGAKISAARPAKRKIELSSSDNMTEATHMSHGRNKRTKNDSDAKPHKDAPRTSTVAKKYGKGNVKALPRPRNDDFDAIPAPELRVASSPAKALRRRVPRTKAESATTKTSQRRTTRSRRESRPIVTSAAQTDMSGNHRTAKKSTGTRITKKALGSFSAAENTALMEESIPPQEAIHSDSPFDRVHKTDPAPSTTKERYDSRREASPTSDDSLTDIEDLSVPPEMTLGSATAQNAPTKDVNLIDLTEDDTLCSPAIPLKAKHDIDSNINTTRKDKMTSIPSASHLTPETCTHNPQDREVSTNPQNPIRGVGDTARLTGFAPSSAENDVSRDLLTTETRASLPALARSSMKDLLAYPHIDCSHILDSSTPRDKSALNDDVHRVFPVSPLQKTGDRNENKFVKFDLSNPSMTQNDGRTTRKVKKLTLISEETGSLSESKFYRRSDGILGEDQDFYHSLDQVLNEIQSEITRKISSRFDHVRRDVRASRKILFEAAKAEIQLGHRQSVDDYNTLVDLHVEYTVYREKLLTGFGCGIKLHRDIIAEANRIIAQHDRSNVVKKFPKLSALPLLLARPNSGIV